MTDYRIDYGSKETTRRGFVDGADTGEPDVFRTFSPTGERRFFLDDVEVDEATFRSRAEAEARGD